MVLVRPVKKVVLTNSLVFRMVHKAQRVYLIGLNAYIALVQLFPTQGHRDRNPKVEQLMK